MFEHLGKRRRWRLGDSGRGWGRRAGFRALGEKVRQRGQRMPVGSQAAEAGAGPPARMSLFQGRGTPLRQNQTVFLGACCGGLPREPGLPWDVADGGRREGSGGWEGRGTGRGRTEQATAPPPNRPVDPRCPSPIAPATGHPAFAPWGTAVGVGRTLHLSPHKYYPESSSLSLSPSFLSWAGALIPHGLSPF